MTLTDFLLARFAEDEDEARRVAAVGSCEPAYRPARVLAECESKRRIVKRFAAPDIHQPDERCEACATLYDLAAPYADHPDYRQEWRP